MVNPDGKPKKYEGRIPVTTSLYLPEPFRKFYKKIISLSQVDEDEEFKEYCSEFEGFSLDRKKNEEGKGVRQAYMRWILSKHVMKNIHKLKK